MANVLNDDKKQQILALGRLGLSLRKIQEATPGTSRDHQRVPERRKGRSMATGEMETGSKAKPVIRVITDFGVGLSGSPSESLA